MKLIERTWNGRNWFAKYEFNGEKLEVIGRTLADCDRLALVMIK